jgi:hypothetical protein
VNDDERKHLELIQAVISRLAGNSFLIRGWAVTLVSALFALGAKDADRRFVIVAYFPCLMFWWLDAYFLSQERKFRSLYDSKRKHPTGDFSIDVTGENVPRTSWAAAFVSKTIFPFYGVILVLISLVMWKLTK